MPDWKMHVHACEKAIKQFKVTYASDFIFGGVLPDTPWIDSKDACKDGTLKCDLHYYLPQGDELAPTPNYYKFLKEYKDFIAMTDIGKGMLFHLILDAVVNKHFNEHTVYLGNEEFSVLLSNGEFKHVSGFSRKVKEKYEDIHAYENTLSVRSLESIYMSYEVKIKLCELGYGGSVDDILKVVNKRLERVHETKNAIFTIEQYEQMVDDAIKIFIDLGNAAYWKFFD